MDHHPLPPTGWIYDPAAVEAAMASLPRPVFGLAASNLQDSGKGKTVLLWQALEKVCGGKFPVHHQTIGDCVSHGWGVCVDTVAAVEILLGGEPEQFVAECATEPLYAASRVEIGGGRISGDGSVGAWAARAVTELGTLARVQYGDVDLRTYSGDRARQWGRTGVPDPLEPTAREHRIRTTSLVRSYDEARDAIAAGYPVAVCSMQGFEMRRDSEGFAKPSGQWAHCMAFLGVDDSGKRPGLLCVNSWGPDWISGPKRLDQPDGSFWVDASVVDRMLSRDPDSFALSGFDGYPARDLPVHFFG